MTEPTIVAVTETEFRKAEFVFRSAPDFRCVGVPGEEDALARTIRRIGVRAVIVGPQAYTSALYEALPAGGIIARFGVGHDGIDKQAATRRGLLCTNTPEATDQSVAELAMLMISAAARDLISLDRATKQGRWEPRMGTEIEGRTLAIIGCGRIGSALARIASGGFGMKIVRVGRHDDYPSAVRKADFVSIHIPATPENAHYFNRERLSHFPVRAWLINTARGAVVDESALYDALAGGRIAGAAIDVFHNEPYTPLDTDRDLRTLPNVILLPHVGSHTPEANGRMAERALRNIRLAAAGNFRAMDLVNPEVLASRSG